MATSAETAAFLAALIEEFSPPRVVETGSGFSSAVLGGALHVENDPEYERRVREWLRDIGADAGTFWSYEAFHVSNIESPLLLFLDGDLRTRECTAAWLEDKLERAVVVIHDAQPGTFSQVQTVLDLLKADPRGRLMDCAAWTRDGYGRSAALWIGAQSGFPEHLAEQILAGPGTANVAVVHLLLCVNDTPENGRWECTVRSLTSIGITVDLGQHPLWIVDNGSSCPNTSRFLQAWSQDQWSRGALLRVFRLPHNRHATYAINRLLAMVPEPDCVIRLENDIEFHTRDWPRLIERFLAHSGFGMACPIAADLPGKAVGVPVTQVAGRRVQVVDQIAGYCTAIAPDLRRQLGALVCAGEYIEDVLTSQRARVLGHRLAWLQPDELLCYHVDRGISTQYASWKSQAVAAEGRAMEIALVAWDSGRRPPFEPFVFDHDDGFEERRF